MKKLLCVVAALATTIALPSDTRAQRTGGTLVIVVGQPTDSNPTGQTDVIDIGILTSGSVSPNAVPCHIPRRTTPNNKADIISTRLNNVLNGGRNGPQVNITRNNNVITVAAINGGSIASCTTNNKSRQRGMRRQIHKPPPRRNDVAGGNGLGNGPNPPALPGAEKITDLERHGVATLTMFASGPWPVQLGIFRVEFGAEGQDGVPPKIVTVDPAAYPTSVHMMVDVARRLRALDLESVQLLNPWQLRFVLSGVYDTMVVGNWQVVSSVAMSTIEQIHQIETR